MKNLSLQQVNKDDWEILAELEKSADSDTYNSITEEKEVKKYIEDSNVFFILLDNEIIGNISYEEKENNEIDFNGLTVLEKHRKQGIASWAMKNVLAKIDNKKEINLVVHPQNTPAVLIYLKAGFVIKGWKDNCFGDGEPRLFLVKK